MILTALVVKNNTKATVRAGKGNPAAVGSTGQRGWSDPATKIAP